MEKQLGDVIVGGKELYNEALPKEDNLSKNIAGNVFTRGETVIYCIMRTSPCAAMTAQGESC